MAFQANSEKSINKIARKYYDSLFFLYLNDKRKKLLYFYVLEYPNVDRVTRKFIKSKIAPKLPFHLNQLGENGKVLIDEFDVLSIDEWNQKFAQFPLTKI